MAVKISDSSIPSLSSVAGTEVVPCSNSGAKGKFVLSKVLDYIRQAAAAFTVSTINKLTITTPATGATLTIADGKTLGASASITLGGADGKTLGVNNTMTLAGTDGTTHTLPATSATIARTDAAQTLNGLQTFADGILSNNDVSGSRAVLCKSNPASVGANGGIGYGAGAGGTVTQLTSKATGVTLDKYSGRITLHNAALNSATAVSFLVSNNIVGANDQVVISHQSAGTQGAYAVDANHIDGGQFYVTVYNRTGGSLSEAIVLQFSVIKSAIA